MLAVMMLKLPWWGGPHGKELGEAWGQTACKELRPSVQQPVRDCQQPLSELEMDPASGET